MIQTNRYLISVTPAGRETEVMLSQYENGRYLGFSLLGLSGEIPDDVVATIQGTKPDGTIYSKVGTYADGVATFEEDTQLTAVEGEWEAKLRLTASSGTIATERIRFVIDPATVEEGAVPSDTQLDGYIAETQANAANARRAADEAETSATSAAESAEIARQAAASLTVDDEMSETSENPVQNKVIDAALTDLKEDFNKIGLAVVEGKLCAVYDKERSATTV